MHRPAIADIARIAGVSKGAVSDPGSAVLAGETIPALHPGGYIVQVTADALVKDLCLFPDRLDPAARVDTGMVTLVAGESHAFAVTSESVLDTAALRRAPILRAANDLTPRI